MGTATSRTHESTGLSNSAYNCIMALHKDADFLYSTVDTYIEDARKDNRSDLVDLWSSIKKDKERHVKMLREALTKEAKEERLK